MPGHIITGGQTGVDQAAWRIAVKWGYKTSGMMPRGFLTEDGCHPEFRGLYGATESRSADHAIRTQCNVKAAEAVLWLGPTGSPDYKATLKACSLNNPGRTSHSEGFDNNLRRRLIEIDDMESSMASPIDMIPTRDFLMSIHTACIAGPRESRYPGIGELTCKFLDIVFAMIRKKTEWDHKEFRKKMTLRLSTSTPADESQDDSQWETKEYIKKSEYIKITMEREPVEDPEDENLDEIDGDQESRQSAPKIKWSPLEQYPNRGRRKKDN